MSEQRATEYPTDTAEVLDKIDSDNPFKDIVRQLRVDDDWDWQAVWEALDEAYDPVDKAAFAASYEQDGGRDE